MEVDSQDGKGLKRFTMGEVDIKDAVELLNITRLQSCFMSGCVENRKGRCVLRYMSIGKAGKCTFFMEKA